MMVTGRARLAGRPIAQPSAPPPHGGRVPVLASHPDIRSRWTHRDRRPLDRSHAGSPQGFLTRRNLISSRCVWLTNAIDRIVKESGTAFPGHTGSTPGSRKSPESSPRSRPLDAIGRSQVPLGNSPRPSFGHRFRSRGKGYYTGRDFRVKSPSDFFQSRSRPPAGAR
jgi:hypothetical protein